MIDLHSVSLKEKWMEDQSNNHWAAGLPAVIFAINTRTSFSTKKTPYQLVFGQDIRANSHYWQSVADAIPTDAILINDLIVDAIEPSETEAMNEQSELTVAAGSIRGESGKRELMKKGGSICMTHD